MMTKSQGILLTAVRALIESMLNDPNLMIDNTSFHITDEINKINEPTGFKNLDLRIKWMEEPQ